GLALLPLALMGLLLSLRLARGWWQALPSAGLVALTLLLFELGSRIDASVPNAAGAISELTSANLFIDPATGLPRAPVITGLLVGGIAVWQARRRGIAGWPLRILIIAIGLFTILRPLIDQRPAPANAPRPAAVSPAGGGYRAPVAIGDRSTWIRLMPASRDAPPGRYRLEARLQLGADGRVAGCRLEKPSGVKPVDLTACLQLMARGRYQPARDVKGRDVAAVDFYALEWTMGETRAAPPAPDRPEPAIRCPDARVSGPMVAEPCMRDAWIGNGEYPAGPLARGESGTVGYKLAINPQGSVERCDVIRSSGHAGLDRDTCALLARRARFVPAQDVDGSPMAWDYESAIAWQLAQR
uniref:energy transducer TonB n=1 Tax=Sandarakinorhabdus oryzae TaxID=2675220 RepID=UPI0012E2B3D7